MVVLQLVQKHSHLVQQLVLSNPSSNSTDVVISSLIQSYITIIMVVDSISWLIIGTARSHHMAKFMVETVNGPLNLLVNVDVRMTYLHEY
jgi:hypothetical protein